MILQYITPTGWLNPEQIWDSSTRKDENACSGTALMHPPKASIATLSGVRRLTK